MGSETVAIAKTANKATASGDISYLGAQKKSLGKRLLAEAF